MYYNESSPVFNLFGVVFVLVLLIFIPLYNISNTEYLENYRFFSLMLHYKNGEINRRRLLIFRWAVFLLTTSLALLTDKVEVVLNLVGSLFIPIISYHIPVCKNSFYLVFNFLQAKTSRKPRGLFIVTHDVFVVLIGLVIQGLGLFYTIKYQVIPEIFGKSN